MLDRPLIFVTAGNFARGGSGYAHRTKLMFDVLCKIGFRGEKIIVSPAYEDVMQLARDRGWIHYSIKRYDNGAQGSCARLKLWGFRWVVFLLAHIFPSCLRVMLSMQGASDIRPNRALHTLLREKRDALVWLSRCDLLHLIPYTLESQMLILDANDTTANLILTYDYRPWLRRFGLWTHANLVRKASALELRMAQKCHLLIAISPEDYTYYKSTCGERVILEEACMAADAFGESPVHSGTRQFTVGFIGANHSGALHSAYNLLKLAKRKDMKNASFAIAGGVCEPLKHEPVTENVTLIGRVSCSLDFLKNCQCIVLWSAGETGASVKFQEAILAGIPVLANRAAARWSLAAPEIDYTCCETEEEFAQAVIAEKYIQSGRLQKQSTLLEISRRLVERLPRGAFGESKNYD